MNTGASAWLATTRTRPRRRPCSSSISERTWSSDAAALADVVHEELAGGGEPHAARQALEQRCAEFVLQVEDAAVDGRGRHVQPLGRLADAAGAGHFVDVAQEAQVVHGSARCTNGASQSVAIAATVVSPFGMAGNGNGHACCVHHGHVEITHHPRARPPLRPGGAQRLDAACRWMHQPGAPAGAAAAGALRRPAAAAHHRPRRSVLVVVDMQNDFCHPPRLVRRRRASASPPCVGRSRCCSACCRPGVRPAPVLWLNWGVRADRANLPPTVLFKGKRTPDDVGYGERSPEDHGRALVPATGVPQVVDELVVERATSSSSSTASRALPTTSSTGCCARRA
jgi:hypothetical protein